MGKIKKILENELVGGTQTNDVYPVTSTKAVYDENNERLDNILGGLGDKIGILKNAGYLYADVATPTTDPGTPNAKVFYIANGKGTYEKFGGIKVTEDEVVVLYYDTAWHKEATGIASQKKLTELDNEVFGEKFNFIAEYTQTSGYQYFPITLKPNVNYSVTKSEDVADVQLKSDTANVISLKTLNSFTLTEEEASLITQLSLYKGTVSINADISESIEQKLGEKADKIEVETLDRKVNNLSADVTIIKDSMLVEEYEDANPTISSGYRSTSGNIYSGGENFAELAVSEGEKLLLYSSGTGVNAQYPTAYYWNNGAYKNTIFVTDKIENVEIVVPSGVDTLYINSTKRDISIKKKVKKPAIDNIRQDVTEIDGSIKNISHNLPNMGKLAFSWKPFDKCYISWNNDDLRTDSYLYKNLCDEFGFPYCVAAPYEVVAKNTQMINGQTPVEFCKSIVANGGEILSHNIKVLTSSSTDEDYNDVFNVSKDTLESAIGCKVRGIILAGGAGYTTVDALKAQGYSMIYYDYSDLYGISPQYHMGRTQTIFESGETDQQLADRMIAKIDDAIANKKWLRMWCHGESEVSIAALRIVFQYIQTKITEGKVEFITWSQGYDKFKPTI